MIGKRLALFGIILGFFVGLVLISPTLAGDVKDVKNDAVITTNSASGDGISSETMGARPTLRLLRYWLSDKQQGTKRITRIRPGEKIYGVFRVQQKGACACVKRLYKIGMYKLSQPFMFDYRCPSTINYSWGFEIPDSKARDGDRPKFFYNHWAVNGNTVSKNQVFTVDRDAHTNSTRAYQIPMDAAHKKRIINSIKTVRNYLKTCRLRYDARYWSYSSSSNIFLHYHKIYRPNVTLIHAHGSAANGGMIELRNHSYVNSSNLASHEFTAPSGLFYAAVCSGAKYTTLGNAFINKGYDAYISYTTGVPTARNADFYKKFFYHATRKNTSVSAALNMTKIWAVAKGWTEVATARLIGDGSELYLGGSSYYPAISAREEEANAEILKTIKYDIEWRDVDTTQLTEAEQLAVAVADRVAEVKTLKKRYEGELTTGIEAFPNFNRVSYKRGDIYFYCVNVDKKTGKIIYKDYMD